jgi:DNA-binding MarR family transcriptional regulator
MLAVRGRPRASQTELVALTGIDRSTLSELMKRLLAQGLVQQERAGVDRRAYAVTLTVPGDCALDLALPALASTEAAILAALAERRRAAFLTALARLLSGLERRS